MALLVSSMLCISDVLEFPFHRIEFGNSLISNANRFRWENFMFWFAFSFYGRRFIYFMSIFAGLFYQHTKESLCEWNSDTERKRTSERRIKWHFER